MKQNNLWVFDFDGTLAPIVANYHAARLHPDCEEMLLMLVENFPGRVAVVSSRPLYDLETRVHVPGIFLGGSWGLTWLLPGGEQKIFSERFQDSLEKNRDAVLPKIKELELLYDVDTEDKLLSYALHVPHLPPQIQQYIFHSAKKLAAAHACEAYQGPESSEIYFLPPEVRTAAIPNLCSVLGRDPKSFAVMYAGDAPCDIPIMQWVLQRTGRVFTVGGTSLVTGDHVVKNPEMLAQEIIRLCADMCCSAGGATGQRSCHGSV